MAANQNRGNQIDYSARYKNLSAEIYSLLQSQEMGLKASVDLENSDIIFDVAIGNDLTAAEGEAGGIVLSLDTKTALEIVDTNDRLNFRNLSVTAGQGEGADRTIEEVYTESFEPAGFDRREIFTDARDIESDDELPTRGAQKLSFTQKARGISVKANNLGSYQIGDDYDLGDLISVDASGELVNAQVTKLKYSYDRDNIPAIDVTLSFDADEALIKDIQAKHMDYDALVAGAGGSSRLVAEYEFAAAKVSHTISNLDINANGGIYKIVIDGAQTVGSNGLLMFINDDTERTNYPAKYSSNGGASIALDTIIGFLDSGRALNDITLSLLRGIAIATAIATVTSDASMTRCSWTKTASVTNITSITFMALNSARPISAGTVIKIYKM